MNSYKIVSIDAQFLTVEWDIGGTKVTEKLDIRYYPTNDAKQLEEMLNKQLEAMAAGMSKAAAARAVAPEVTAMVGVKKEYVKVEEVAEEVI